MRGKRKGGFVTEVTAEPTSKEELLARMREGREDWDAVLARVPAAAMTRLTLSEGWSVKDLVAHVMAYERWTAAQIRGAATGQPPTNLQQFGTADVPGDIDEMSLDERNAAIWALYRDRPTAEVLDLARQAFDDLVGAIEGLPEETVTAPGAQGWTGGVALVAIVPKQSYEHYRQHLPDLLATIA